MAFRTGILVTIVLGIHHKPNMAYFNDQENSNSNAATGWTSTKGHKHPNQITAIAS